MQPGVWGWGWEGVTKGETALKFCFLLPHPGAEHTGPLRPPAFVGVEAGPAMPPRKLKWLLCSPNSDGAAASTLTSHPPSLLPPGLGPKPISLPQGRSRDLGPPRQSDGWAGPYVGDPGAGGIKGLPQWLSCPVRPRPRSWGATGTWGGPGRLLIPAPAHPPAA